MSWGPSGSRHMVASNMEEMFKTGRGFGSLVLSLLPQPIKKQLWRTPGPASQEARIHKWTVGSLSAHSYGCSCPSAWHFMAQDFAITSQPECVTLCSHPGRVRKTKYNPGVSWFTHLHPNTCVLICTQLAHLQISFTSPTKLCILAFTSLQNVHVTLFQVVL